MMGIQKQGFLNELPTLARRCPRGVATYATCRNQCPTAQVCTLPQLPLGLFYPEAETDLGALWYRMLQGVEATINATSQADLKLVKLQAYRNPEAKSKIQTHTEDQRTKPKSPKL